MSDWIGYRWLADHYGVATVQALPVQSSIGKSRTRHLLDGVEHEQYVSTSRPSPTLAGHLGFALKHEGVHLEFLSRLFQTLPASELEAWIHSEPTGQYTRRAGFFYEFLTERQLDFPGVSAGNYVNALDSDRTLTATTSTNVPRWRVRDNLPGSRQYCPTARLTPKLLAAQEYDCAAKLAELEIEFGPDLLRRSAVWLTLKESRASFTIEHEARQNDRIQRFASVMEQWCGRFDDPLTESALSTLQREILGARAIRHGIRRSPVFVGNVSNFSQAVHYIAPHWQDLPELLNGLRQFAQRTAGASSLIRAAVLSFGFVYIHPMSDGNGRISRFIINDTLRRDKAVPTPFILPISATITKTHQQRQAYDEILETFSRAFMRHYADAWSFGPEKAAEDGVRHNLQFDAWEDARHAWRYPDLTRHAEYLADIVRRTLEDDMRHEADQLHRLRTARERIKQILEGPDQDIDRIIRSVRENDGKVSRKLTKEFPALDDAQVSEEIGKIIRDIFDLN